MPSSWIMRARDVGTGSRSSHALDLLGQDLDDDAHLAGPAIGVPITARVLLGERVDVRVGVLLGHLDDASAHLNVAVGIVGILHRERDLRAPLEVLVLYPAPGGVETDVRAVVVYPDRGHLRRAVAADGRDVGERLLPKDVAEALRDRRQDLPPISQ